MPYDGKVNASKFVEITSVGYEKQGKHDISFSNV